MSVHVRDERRDFVATLRAVGPDAPTLCTGWDARMLVTHLIRRERSLLEMGARARVPGLAGLAETAMANYASTHDYADLVDTFAAGSPSYSPFTFGPIEEAVNLLEYVVHHEDVRRAVDPDAEPRVLDPARSDAVFRRLRGAAKLTMRSAPVHAQLSTLAGQQVGAGRGPVTVVVTGEPVELALVAFGRQRAARVNYSGPEDAVAALAAAKLGT
jgi:uncharacterized protein (TIGR03085 family)